MLLPVRVEQVYPVQIVVVRCRARQSELATVVPRACGIAWQFVSAHQLKGGRNVAVYLNADIQVEAGVEVGEPFEPDGEIVRSATLAGLAATVAHFGRYQELGSAHQAIRSWCEANGYVCSGANWELYGHWQPEWDANPSSIRTDVFYQVIQT